MKKVLLVLLAVLVGGVFGGVEDAEAFGSPSIYREVCAGEAGYRARRSPNGDFLENYFDIELEGDTDISVRSAEASGSINSNYTFPTNARILPVTAFFQLGLGGEDSPNLRVKPVCQNAAVISLKLQKISKISVLPGEDGVFREQRTSINDRETALAYGIVIPTGLREETVNNVAEGDWVYINNSGSYADVGSSNIGRHQDGTTPVSPNIAQLRDGSYFFEYIIYAEESNPGEGSAQGGGVRTPEVETRPIIIYIEKTSASEGSNPPSGSGAAAPPPGVIQTAEWQFAPCPEDVNRDGNINIIDLVTVARRFGERVSGVPVDVNGDGNINIIDLVTVARKFGQRCPDAGAYISPTGERVVFVPVPVARQSQNAGFASVLKSILWVMGN